MDTTINTGWTPPAKVMTPATRPQLVALMAYLQTLTALPERDNALDALDNAIECLDALADADAVDHLFRVDSITIQGGVVTLATPDDKRLVFGIPGGPEWTPGVVAAGENLGTHVIISGGEVLEIDAPAQTSDDDEIQF